MKNLQYVSSGMEPGASCKNSLLQGNRVLVVNPQSTSSRAEEGAAHGVCEDSLLLANMEMYPEARRAGKSGAWNHGASGDTLLQFQMHGCQDKPHGAETLKSVDTEDVKGL